MSELRGDELVRLDSVGGTMLLVRADLHRDGLDLSALLLWPREQQPSAAIIRLFGNAAGEIETEGLGIMARDMGVQCWGLPDLEIIHR